MENIFRRRAKEANRRALKEQEQRLVLARTSIEQNPSDANAYIAAARCCKQLGHLYEALEILKRGISRCAPSPGLYEYYIERLEKCNQTEEAIAAAREASFLFPDQIIFSFREALLLPVFYDTPKQVQYYRQRFTEGLLRMIDEVGLESPQDREQALIGIGKNVNKYLAYQALDDRDLQTLYGNWVHQIMQVNYPHLTEPRCQVPKTSDARLRVGYVSARFRDGSVMKGFSGWLREHNRDVVELFVYHASRTVDATTRQLKIVSEHFQQLPGELEEAALSVRSNDLHVLVFLDLGMDALMMQFGALRLAPIQCMAWDYPVTSGLPTIDYCFTGELMEPENAQDHYSEKLVRLPGVGVSYTKPVIPDSLLFKTRGDFGLREGAPVYLSGQTIFKYLPDQDYLFAQIARRVPNAQFVFLVSNEVLADDFRRRLDGAFSANNLSAADHCVLLPEVSTLDYWNLHRVSDVVLDTIGWSGGISTFEAIACGLPVVTLPGTFMRGRQSSAILTQLGVRDTIAQNDAEYVDLAVRLGLDRRWRRSIIDRMVDGYPQLYSDTRSIRTLEEFYRQVVDERLPT